MSYIKQFVIFAIIIGTYSRYGVYIQGIRIPFIIAILGALLGTTCVHNYRKKIVTASLLFLFSIGFITLASLAEKTGVGIENLKSYAGLCVSIIVLNITIHVTNSLKKELFSNTLLYIILLVVIFSVLDIFTEFHRLNILLKESMGGVQHNPPRLESVVGQVRRPFPFTLEPSYTAGLLLVLLPVWYSYSKKRFLFYTLVFLSILIVRSPILIPAILIGFLMDLGYLEDRNYASLKIKQILPVIIAITGVWFIMGSRIMEILNLNDLSAYARLVEPLYFSIRSFLQNPVLGPGLGEYGYLSKLVVSRVKRFGDAHYGYLFSQPLAQMGAVGLFSYIAYIVYLFKTLLTGVPRTVSLLHYVVLGFAMSAFISVPHWVYLAIILNPSISTKQSDATGLPDT